MSNFPIGSTVQVIVPDYETPASGWGAVKSMDVGVVTGVDEDGDTQVDFPKHFGWCAAAGELAIYVKPKKLKKEKAMGKFQVGDKVVVVTQNPTYGRGSVRPGDVGVVVGTAKGYAGCFRVDFTRQSGWLAGPKDLAKVPSGKKEQKAKSQTLKNVYVVTHNTVLVATFTTRKEARKAKASLGGKSQGAVITQFTASNEIR